MNEDRVYFNKDELCNDDENLYYEITVDEAFNGFRLDAAVSKLNTEISRSRVQKLISANNVLINGSIITDKNYRLKTGDRLLVIVPPPETVDIKPENIDINIIYEDSDILVVDKPKGMVVHPAAGNYSGTLVNALLFHCSKTLSGINGELRPGIVHRIDKDTSGVLVVCKNDKAHIYLAELLSRHDIKRVYYCLAFGIFKKKSGTVEAPIGRHPLDRKKMAVNSLNGRNAVTHYRVLEEYGNKYSLVECTLETGRTHQIRVHMASLRHPLVGDTLYGPEKQPFKTNGQLLHAAVLGFIHPSTGEYMEFSSPMPYIFYKTIEKIAYGNMEKANNLQSMLLKGNGVITD